jgi:hypothetical protein
LVTPTEQPATEAPTEDSLPPLDDDLGPNGAPLLMEEEVTDEAPVDQPAGDVASEADADAPEGSTEAPEGESPEPPADAPPADAPVEPAPDAPRTYTQAEVSAMQSTMRQRENEAVARANAAEKATEEAQLLIRADEFQQERTQHHIDLGEMPERAAALAKDDRTSALNEVRAAQSQSETATAQRQAAALAVGHDMNLPAEEITNLLQFNSVEEMQAHGQAVLDRIKTSTETTDEVKRLRQEIADLKREAVPAGGPSAIVDSNVGQTPALTDQQIVDRAGDPNIDISDAEMAELDAAMQRLGYLDA